MDDHKNFAYGTVLTPPSPAASGTSLVLQSGQGALMPTPPFNATVWPAGTQPLASNAEIVRVTAIGTDTLTITRTQEGSSARSILAGDQFAATITDKILDELTSGAVQLGTRAAQPAASAVQPGTLYFVTDEGLVERSTGAAWESYGPNQWTDVSYSAGDYTANGSMTWTVDSGDVVSKYVRIGKTLIWTVIIGGSSVGGTPSTRLQIALPGGFTSVVGTAPTGYINQNGNDSYTGFVITGAGNPTNQVAIALSGGANWAASTNGTYVFFTIPIQLA